MSRKYLLRRPFQVAKISRLIAKAIDIFIALVLSISIYPIGLLLAIAYIIASDSLHNGQSVGKRFIGFAVISLEDGLPCSLKQSLIRNLPFIVPLCLALIPFFGWVLALIVGAPLMVLEVYLLLTLDSGLRLGDVMADTSVMSNTDSLVESGTKSKTSSSWFEKDPSSC